MPFESELTLLGLTKQEIRVYLYLLEHGDATPPQVARGAHLLRPNTYPVLESLKNKGLLEGVKLARRTAFRAKDPSSILRRADEQKRVLENVLPDLSALYKSQMNKPTVKFYYGLEEVRDVYLRTDGAEEILFVTSTDILYSTYPKHFTNYRKQLTESQVFVRDILTQEAGKAISRETRALMRGYYDARYLPRKYEDAPTSIRIWNNTLALATFDDPVTCTVIENQALVKTFKTMFEVMWSAAEKLN